RRLSSSPPFPYTTLFRSFGIRRQTADEVAHFRFLLIPFPPGAGGPADAPQARPRRQVPQRLGHGHGVVPTPFFSTMATLGRVMRSEEHTSELQSPDHLVC